MNKKIYISLPIAIAEDSVQKRYFQSIREIGMRNEIADYAIVGPVNISEFGPDGLKTEREHSYAWYMGQDIERLLECDAIYMSHGWVSSKGCNAELAVAKVYNIPVYYADDINHITI